MRTKVGFYFTCVTDKIGWQHITPRCLTVCTEPPLASVVLGYRIPAQELTTILVSVPMKLYYILTILLGTSLHYSYEPYQRYLTGNIPLTLPMLRLLSFKAQGCKDFWKTSKHCHAGIQWIALTEHSQMSTMCQLFFWFLHHFVLAKLVTNSIRLKTKAFHDQAM